MDFPNAGKATYMSVILQSICYFNFVDTKLGYFG